VRVKILEIDSERRRLSLSIKRVEGQVLPVRPIVPPEGDAADLDNVPELGLSEDVFAGADEPAVAVDEPEAETIEPEAVAPEAVEPEAAVEPAAAVEPEAAVAPEAVEPEAVAPEAVEPEAGADAEAEAPPEA
jgi:small subunit ribosomal protein S1